jgi:hypothetical protein
MVDTIERPDTIPAMPIVDVDLSSFEEAAKRLRSQNEHLLDGWKTAANSMISFYSEAASALLDLRETVLESQLEWMSAVTSAQGVAIRQAQATQAKLARELLG